MAVPSHSQSHSGVSTAFWTSLPDPPGPGPDLGWTWVPGAQPSRATRRDCNPRAADPTARMITTKVAAIGFGHADLFELWHNAQR
jgi:hypothetical protein